MEVWKEIEGYENRYEVSNLGNIKSLLTNKILKPRVDKNGYFKVILYDLYGITKEYRLHRLVAQMFIPNPDNLPQVNHIDENKENNCVDNLEWCTAKQNSNHGTRNNKLRYKNIERGMRKAKKVYQYSLEGDLIKEWESLRSIERELGIPHSNIITSIKRNGTCGGFKWKLND